MRFLLCLIKHHALKKRGIGGMAPDIHINVRVKCTLVQALRLCTGRTAHRGSRGIALLFHDHSIRRGPLFTPGKEPVPIVQEAGWAQGRSGQVRKNSPPLGFHPRTVQLVASRYTD